MLYHSKLDFSWTGILFVTKILVFRYQSSQQHFQLPCSWNELCEYWIIQALYALLVDFSLFIIVIEMSFRKPFHVLKKYSIAIFFGLYISLYLLNSLEPLYENDLKYEYLHIIILVFSYNYIWISVPGCDKPRTKMAFLKTYKCGTTTFLYMLVT